MIQGFYSGKNRLSTSVGRWASVGPYYAMFPIQFAFDVVEQNCPSGGAVLDPFAGRCSSIYAATVTGRFGYGVEINEVGWVYGKAKIAPASENLVLKRNREIGNKSKGVRNSQLAELPEFFRYCYTPTVLRYLIAARNQLDWENNAIDATLMAIVLVYLHGAKEKSLSNQMRQGKAMAPEYSVKWWKENESTPPEISPTNFMDQRIRWRYAKGIPSHYDGKVQRGNSVQHLDTLKSDVDNGHVPQFDLLFTSPPYYNITSYHYDQWLRLWMLRHNSVPSKTGGEWQNGFWSKSDYETLLSEVFTKCSRVMKPEAKVWIRTDARQYTRQVTIDLLTQIFPEKKLEIKESPIQKSSQTALYGDKTQKPGETDIVMLPK